MKQQSGMILIQVLLGVTLLMLISSAAFEILHLSVTQTQAYRQQNVVFAAAEQTLATAITAVAQLTQEPNGASICNDNVCIYPLQPTRNFFDLAMWQQAVPNQGTAELPQYVVIEWLEHDPQPNKTSMDYFQITAMSYNVQNHARRILQVVVSKVFDENGKAINQEAFVQSWRVL